MTPFTPDASDTAHNTPEVTLAQGTHQRVDHASAEGSDQRMRRLIRSWLLESLAEFRKVMRMPAYAIPTVLFPCMFYVLFGLSFGSRGSMGPVTPATYLLATYGAFGVIGAALFGFGVGVAIERGQGWLLLKRASPMPIPVYFGAKLVMALLMSTVVVLLLMALGLVFGDVPREPMTLLSLLAVLVGGAVPFCAMGLLLGIFLGPNSAPAIVNLIYLPMAFASGLWIPITVLPSFFQQIAPYLPAYHYGQLALAVVGADDARSNWIHVGMLAAMTGASLLAAVWAWKRDEDRTYG